MTIHDLSLNLGLRFDNYDGISHGSLLQPRLGVAYHVKKTNSVLRFAYTRTFETPYNENLVLSSSTGSGGLANGILGSATAQPLQPGRRNQFNTGIQQGIGRYIIIDADYFWKYTTNAYDFNVILNSPLAFPISWSRSKLDGVAVRVNLAEYKGFSAFFVAGHTRARYFPPETGGLFFNSFTTSGSDEAPVDAGALRDLAERAAAAAGLDVYGGDLIVERSGRLTLIDLNDWPSFAPCRPAAAAAIADYLTRRAHGVWNPGLVPSANESAV